MTTLTFNGTDTLAAADFEAMEKSNARKENWIRYYGPATVIMGSLLYVVHSWMAIA
jgi:hypothetical protein